MNYVELYSKNEELNIQKCTYTERNIFIPVTHIAVNNPTRIQSELDLPYFACTMHNNKASTIIEDYLNGISNEELILLEKIIDGIYKLTKQFGLATVATSSLLQHLYQLRIIKLLFPNTNNFLEIGPGSGYLGLMLALEGKNIISTDVTQAYYLWQTYLYDYFKVLKEFVNNNDIPNIHAELEKNNNGKILHIPWWQFKSLNKNINIDVIIVNHAICEMHPLAIKHLISFSCRNGYPQFFMEGIGLDDTNLTFMDVQQIFYSYGYTYIEPIENIYIFIHNNKKLRLRWIKNKIMRSIPFYYLLADELNRLKIEYRAIFKFFNIQVRHKSIFKRNVNTIQNLSLIYEKITGNKKISSLDEDFLDYINFNK